MDLTRENLSRLNHFSRRACLELEYAYLCKELKDKKISREFFDIKTKPILKLLRDKDFLEAPKVRDFYVKRYNSPLNKITD